MIKERKEPRLSKKGLQLDNLKLAAPDLFKKHTVPSRRTFAWKAKVTHHEETSKFYKDAGVEIATDMGAVPLLGLMNESPTLMWEHSGTCQCGKRSYMFGQCTLCMREEADEKLKVDKEVFEDVASEATGVKIVNPELAGAQRSGSAKTMQGKWVACECGGEVLVGSACVLCGDSHACQESTNFTGRQVRELLPNVLAQPAIMTGRKTSSVYFLTDIDVRYALTNRTSWVGPVSIQSWKSGHDLYLEKTSKIIGVSIKEFQDLPFRMVFVAETGGRKGHCSIAAVCAPFVRE